MKKKPLCSAAAVLAALCLSAQPLPASCECVSADLSVQFGSALLYYSQDTGAWYDAAGSLLTDGTEPVQTALYEGALYTVDLAAMQVTAADGSVNSELTALLPEYLAFRPVSVWAIDGQSLDDLIADEGAEAVWASVREITGTLPLTYRFSSTTEPFSCEISLCGEVVGGMQYSIDAGDAPEAVPWCNESAGCSVRTGSFPLGEPSAPKQTEKTVSAVQFFDSRLLYDAQSGGWYTAAGSLLTDSTEPVQTALYEGVLYTVDLAAMQVTAADGSVNSELTALLPEYLAFRPVSVWAIDGQSLDDLIADEGAEAVWASVREITGTLPLTYRFSSTTEPFSCEISLCGEVVGGMQYSIDAGDAPEAVPWCSESAGCSVRTAYTGMGDLNLNGRNDIADAILLARFLAEDAEASVSQLGKELADMNGDGFLLADDLGLVLSALAGL